MSSAVVPAQRRHRMVVAREQYKFSVAHMTVFPDGTKERLHGHNYQVGAVLELTDISFAHMIAFAPIKDALADLRDPLDTAALGRTRTLTSTVGLDPRSDRSLIASKAGSGPRGTIRSKTNSSVAYSSSTTCASGVSFTKSSPLVLMSMKSALLPSAFLNLPRLVCPR